MVDNPNHRVIVIGWDGASLALAERWADEGLLPNLAAMRANGAWGKLASTVPPISAPAWATFVTGNNPGRHGIYYFKEHVADTYETRLVCGGDRRGKPIWQMLGEQGRRMGVVNLVMTYPPEPMNGFLVSGMDTPSEKSDFTYPPALKQELVDHLGRYIVELPLEEEARNRRYDELWAKISAGLENRIEAVRYLMHAKDWDVFAVNFRATDSVQHHFWKFMDPAHPQHDPTLAGRYGDCIQQVYRRLDQFLGEVRTGLDPDSTLIVMSDHGFGPTSDKVLYLNNWLAQQGWLAFRQRSEADAGRLAPLRTRLRSFVWEKVWVKLRQAVPQVVKDALERLAPGLYQRIRYPAAYFFIDWEHTRAYADEYQESIWINLAGREPQGIVQPGAEYDALRQAILDRLQELRDPVTAEPLLDIAGRREEIYHGAALEQAPDIVLITRQDPYVRVRPSHTSLDQAALHTLTPAELQAESLPSGVHRLEGMFFAEGPGIVAGRQLSGIGIVDMAPTMLHLAGCQVPRGLDGRVISQMFEHEPDVALFDDDRPEDRPHAGEYDEAEEQLVADRLRGLGYLS